MGCDGCAATHLIPDPAGLLLSYTSAGLRWSSRDACCESVRLPGGRSSAPLQTRGRCLLALSGAIATYPLHVRATEAKASTRRVAEESRHRQLTEQMSWCCVVSLVLGGTSVLGQCVCVSRLRLRGGVSTCFVRRSLLGTTAPEHARCVQLRISLAVISRASPPQRSCGAAVVGVFGACAVGALVAVPLVLLASFLALSSVSTGLWCVSLVVGFIPSSCPSPPSPGLATQRTVVATSSSFASRATLRAIHAQTS